MKSVILYWDTSHRWCVAKAQSEADNAGYRLAIAECGKGKLANAGASP